MGKLTKTQMKRTCIIGLKLAIGDYFGATQDLSFSKVSFQKILKVPRSRSSP